MLIHMLKLGSSEILAGATNGRKILEKLLEQTDKEPGKPEPVFLDFAGINVATASFLREAVVAYRNIVRSRRSNFYPVIANANQIVEDELKVLIGTEGDVLLLCVLDEDDQPRQPRLLGKLDPKQSLTFDLVQERGVTDAAELMRDHSAGENIKRTAWNNRLAALASLGLVVELNEGRMKRYRPLLSEN
jgi:STAS-like domain of unknown function (DUF4325)